MLLKLFRNRRYQLRLVKLYVVTDCWIKLRGDWEIIDCQDKDKPVARLENFARFQAKRACRLWNRFNK